MMRIILSMSPPIIKSTFAVQRQRIRRIRKVYLEHLLIQSTQIYPCKINSNLFPEVVKEFQADFHGILGKNLIA